MPLSFDGRGEQTILSPGPARAQAHETEFDGFRGHLDIGLVNNMPTGAFKATERQFARLLAEASGRTDIRLHLFSLAEIPRDPASFGRISQGYGDLGRLQASRLDALIVTGAEPVAEALADEPYWSALTRVIDWAEHNTVSTLWSCLAAHAAVLHLDGIQRRRLPRKRFGLFECSKVASDGLFKGAPAELRVPHSRWNDIAEGDLRSHGYQIASRSLEAGIDAFTKQWGSRFVFLQGHPEYETDTLFREYRRDAQRFLKGERREMPMLPHDYFDAESERRIEGFAGWASQAHDGPQCSAMLPGWSVRPAQIQLWMKTSIALFRNWLVQIASDKR